MTDKQLKMQETVLQHLWEMPIVTWMQITLPRILFAMWANSAKNYLTSYEFTWICNIQNEYDEWFKRKMFTDEWEDATLFDQSEATQDAIYNLLQAKKDNWETCEQKTFGLYINKYTFRKK